MTAEQIQQIREKYKNPLYMKNAINNVAGILAEEYIKQEMKVETEVDGGKKKMEKTAIKMTRFDELENVLLNQIEMLNDESILTDKESATIAIEKSKAISDLTGNFTELQKVKLDIVKTARKERGVYDKERMNELARKYRAERKREKNACDN